MKRQLIYTLNLALVGLSSIVLLLALVSFLKTGEDAPLWDGPTKETKFAVSAFEQPALSFETLSETLLQLKFETPKLQLPDLSKVLTYLGSTGRPDAGHQKEAVFFALANNSGMAPVAPGEKLYLLYDRNEKPSRYVFSPDNEPTSLWLEVTPQEKSAKITLSLVGEENELITQPAKNREFVLSTREIHRTSRPSNWMIGKTRVDGTLLARQKAKWYGEDRFFERHGGDEYADIVHKQRIDFGEGEENYSLFVNQGDVIVWNGLTWEVKEPGLDTREKPLLYVKKIADRLITFDLWNEEGTSKMTLNLLKSQERFQKQQLQHDFKFIATKTRSQYVFEVGGQKMTLRPQDWLVKTDAGWEKIETAEEIDEYVDRKLQGPLFVFDGVSKLGDKQVLTATLFNPSRTEMESFELDVPTSSVTVLKIPRNRTHLVENTDTTETEYQTLNQ